MSESTNHEDHPSSLNAAAETADTHTNVIDDALARLERAEKKAARSATEVDTLRREEGFTLSMPGKGFGKYTLLPMSFNLDAFKSFISPEANKKNNHKFHLAMMHYMSEASKSITEDLQRTGEGQTITQREFLLGQCSSQVRSIFSDREGMPVLEALSKFLALANLLQEAKLSDANLFLLAGSNQPFYSRLGHGRLLMSQLQASDRPESHRVIEAIEEQETHLVKTLFSDLELALEFCRNNTQASGLLRPQLSTWESDLVALPDAPLHTLAGRVYDSFAHWEPVYRPQGDEA